MGKMIFQRDKDLVKVIPTVQLDTLNVSKPVRMTPVLIDSSFRHCRWSTTEIFCGAEQHRVGLHSHILKILDKHNLNMQKFQSISDK